jgi:hypothetical protein
LKPTVSTKASIASCTERELSSNAAMKFRPSATPTTRAESSNRFASATTSILIGTTVLICGGRSVHGTASPPWVMYEP